MEALQDVLTCHHWGPACRGSCIASREGAEVAAAGVAAAAACVHAALVKKVQHSVNPQLALHLALTLSPTSSALWRFPQVQVW